jgi:hypothetical protein
LKRAKAKLKIKQEQIAQNSRRIIVNSNDETP